MARGRSSQDAAGRRSKGHGAKSAAVREQAILALLSEPTLERAAKRANVAESTLRQWLSSDDAFTSAYDDARRAAFKAGIARVQALTGRAVETLEQLLDAKKFPAVRLGAARTVAEIGMYQHDAETILRRLDDLEKALARQRRP